MSNYDALIIGAGVTGLSLGIALADKGHKCLIIDKNTGFHIKTGETLSGKAINYFKKYNIQFDLEFSTPIYSRKVYWEDNFENNMIFSPFGMEISLTRNVFEELLANENINCGNIVRMGIEHSAYKYRKTGWDINIDGKQLRTQLIFDCTGRNGLKFIPQVSRKYYDNHWAYSTVIDNLHTDNTFEIEATKQGWLYSTSTAADKRIYSAITNIYVPQGQLGQQLFSKLFDYAKYIRLPLNQTRRVFCFDARTSWVGVQTGKGWFSVGDACYSIDPLSGMGIGKNLGMIEFLVDNTERMMAHDLEFSKEYLNFNQLNFQSNRNMQTKEYQKLSHWKEESFWSTWHEIT